MKKTIKTLAASILLFAFSINATSQTAEMKRFESNMNKAKWENTAYGFSRPAFMSQENIFDGETLTTFATYTSGRVTLSYCELGSWATDESLFPVSGSVIAPNVTIDKVTYKNNKGDISSGYTKDGRAFYMKTDTESAYAGGMPHAEVLALIFPKTFHNAVSKLITVIDQWHK